MAARRCVVEYGGRSAKLAGDASPPLGGLYELLPELDAPLQIDDARLSFWPLSVSIQALRPSVVLLFPSVPFSLVAVSSRCRRLRVLGVLYILAGFPVVPQAAELLLYLVKHIVGQLRAQLLVELDQQRIPAAVAGNPVPPTVGNAQEYSSQCFGVHTGVLRHMYRIEQLLVINVARGLRCLIFFHTR